MSTENAPGQGAPPPASGHNEKAAASDSMKVTLRGPDGEIKQEVIAG